MALGRDSVQDLYPEEVAKGITEGTILLVDVREPSETDVERYPEAVYMPMSEFDPSALPDPGRQAGRVRVPLRQPLGDGIAARAERGTALQRAPCRRHQGLEGSRPADRDVSGASRA